jgi:hypothetical protein
MQSIDVNEIRTSMKYPSEHTPAGQQLRGGKEEHAKNRIPPSTLKSRTTMYIMIMRMSTTLTSNSRDGFESSTDKTLNHYNLCIHSSDKINVPNSVTSLNHTCIFVWLQEQTSKRHMFKNIGLCLQIGDYRVWFFEREPSSLSRAST